MPTALQDLASVFLLCTVPYASVQLTYHSFPNKICPVLSSSGAPCTHCSFYQARSPSLQLLLISLSLHSLDVSSSRKPSLILLNEWCTPLLFALMASHMFSIIMLILLYYLGDSSVSCLSPLPDYKLCEGRYLVCLLTVGPLGSTITFGTLSVLN